MARILLVEGEQTVAESLARALAHAGHATTTVGTRAEALSLADDAPFDIALVDETLPDGDGLALVQALHRLAHAPVVVLAESRDGADRDAWRDGAEDYAVKPVSQAETVALVHAVLRRWEVAGGGEVLCVGALELDTLTNSVRLAGKELKLPPKEVALLTRLMRAAGHPVSRDELMHDVWGDDSPDASRTLDVHVGTLRSRLGDDPAAPRFVHTVRGVGFRFSAPEELPGADGDAGPEPGSDGHR